MWSTHILTLVFVFCFLGLCVCSLYGEYDWGYDPNTYQTQQEEEEEEVSQSPLVSEKILESVRVSKFSWNACDDLKNPVVDIPRLVVRPDTIVVPGKVAIAVDIRFKSILNPPIRSHLDVAMSIQGVWVNVCSYLREVCDISDLCIYLQKLPVCPKQLKQQGFNCRCPVQKGSYNVTFSQEIKSPLIPVSGSFLIKWRLHDNSGEIGCYQTTFDVRAN